MGAAHPLRAFERGGAHHVADLLGPVPVTQFFPDLRQQFVDLRVLIEELFVQIPIRYEAAIPQLQAAVGPEHRDRFEQAVEGRGARPQQRVLRGRQLQLLGAVLGQQQQAAIGIGLGEDPQMRAIGQRPAFFESLVRNEPFLALGAPGGEVAHLGDAVLVARDVEPAIEAGLFAHQLESQPEGALERAIGEGQLVIGVELRDPGRQFVEHIALRDAERGESARQFLHILDIDRVAGDPFGPQR